MNLLLYFLMTIAGAFLAISVYEWIKAERDERQWRKLMQEELDAGIPTVHYRLVRDDRSDRE